MTIDLKLISDTGNISYRMNFDTVASAVTYGEDNAYEFEVLATYYDSEQDKEVTKVVYECNNPLT